MRRRNRGVFISWTHHHGRSEELARRLNVPTIFIGSCSSPRSWTAPFRYALAALRTAHALQSLRPNVVIVMQPPLPAALVAFAYCKVRNAKLVLDLHTGVFNDPKWSWALPITRAIGRRSRLCIVTNEPLKNLLTLGGVPAFVLHDIPDTSTLAPTLASDRDEPFVLVPCSYAGDEPLELLCNVALEMPEVNFLFTGDAPLWFRDRLVRTKNVELTGFVSLAEYRKLVASCAAVLCLTIREHTMQRGGYEALAACKPLITSDFTVLREYFTAGTVFCANDVDATSHAVESTLLDATRLCQEMTELLREKRQSSEATVQELERLIFESDSLAIPTR